MKIISIVNQKGGCGKTTTTLSLGAALAERGFRVLIVDLDQQHNATDTLYGRDYNGYSTVDMIYFATRQIRLQVEDFIRYSDREKLDYIPAVSGLSTAPSILANDQDSGTVLARIFRHPYFTKYDYILLDNKPSLDLLVVNALAASNEVLVPVEPEDYSINGLTELRETIRRVQDSLNPGLEFNGIVISRAAMVRTEAQKAEQLLRQEYGNLVYKTIIPNRADVANAKRAGVTVLQQRGSDLGNRFRALAAEIVSRG